jgi:hypothetical protein
MGRPKKLVTKSKKQIDREHNAWKNLHMNPGCRVTIFSVSGEITYSRVGRSAIQERFGLDPCSLTIGRPRYAGGDLYILARRRECAATFVWWRHYPNISGPSDTPLGSLLGRRCWENKDYTKGVAEGDLGDDGEPIKINSGRFYNEVTSIRSKFDMVTFNVGGETLVPRKRQQRKGPWCLKNPPIRKPQRRLVGSVVNIVTPEIPFAPNWREAMADAMRFVAHNREKLTPLTSAWNALAGHGDTDPEYTEPARSWVTLEKMPQGKTQRTLAEYRLELDAMLDKTGRLMAQRESDGRFTLAGGKSGAERHISASYRASIAPLELKLAA